MRISLFFMNFNAQMNCITYLAILIFLKIFWDTGLKRIIAYQNYPIGQIVITHCRMPQIESSEPIIKKYTPVLVKSIIILII